jgi:pilus assembly protein CpaE
MTRILFVDDEPINHPLVARALEALGAQLQFAENGKQAIALAHSLTPDLLITDVMMPDLTGYEVTRQLRREAQFASLPILVLTAQSGLQDKLKSFEAGADDHMTKPFEPAELAARVTALLRRVEAARAAALEPAPKEGGRMIALHSLRGGTGCSSLAVNLGVGLVSLWQKPTVLLDLTMTAGQVALMLNMTLRRTWADISHLGPADLDPELLASVVGRHESGLSFVAAPTFPSQAQPLREEMLAAAIGQFRNKYEYVLADLPHDFSEAALPALDAADLILMVGTPDMASIRAVTAALDTYRRLGYGPEKTRLLLNATFPQAGLPKEKIESALGLQAIAVIPYVQNVFVEAINRGVPPVHDRPQEAITGLLEDFALFVSKDEHKKSRPENPTEAWKRAYKRYQDRKK